jgi:hypothetical protein
MVNIIKRLLPVLLVLVFASCASAPKEKTDELDGTDWTWRISDNSYERFKFRAGKYYYITAKFGFSETTTEGTYSIDGDKIIFVKNTGGTKATYVFSEDRQKFWQQFESGKYHFTRDESWAELFTGKK